MEIRVRVFDSLETARESWRTFQEKGHLFFFQTLEWLENWQTHIGNERAIKPCLVAVFRESDRPLYFFPFEIRKRGSLTELSWLGDGLIDYGAPIVCPPPLEELGKESDTLFKRIWETVLESIPPVDLIWLKKMPATIDGHENPLCSLPCKKYHSKAHYTDLSGTWDEFYKRHAGPKTRSKDRRKQRRLAEMGKLSFTVTNGSDRNVFDTMTRAMLEQKQGRYRDIQAADFLAPACYRSFFTNPSPSLLGSGALHVSGLYLNETVITTHWGMTYRNRFYHFMPSFSRGPWAKYSSGRMLLFHLFEWCFQNNIRVFDFTIGDEEYKRDWCDSVLPLYQYLRAVTWKGKLHESLYRTFVALLSNELLLGMARKARRLLYRIRYRAF